MKNQKWEICFGELRSILSRLNTLNGRVDFWKWVEFSQQNYPNEYKEQAIEYINDSLEGCSLNRAVSGWDEFLYWSEVAPFVDINLTVRVADEIPVMTTDNVVGLSVDGVVSNRYLELLTQKGFFPNLEFLNLSSTGFYDRHLVYLSRFDNSLKSVNLSNNQLSERFDCLRDLSGLIRLDLSSNEITDRGIACLVDSCKDMSLEKLDVSNNKLSYDGFQCLLNYVKACGVDLLFDGNEINGQIVVELMRTIWKDKKCLDLSECDLCDDDLIYMVEYQGFHDIKSIDLSCNDISVFGLIALFGMASFEALEFIDLSFNQLSKENVIHALDKSNSPVFKSASLISIEGPSPQLMMDDGLVIYV